MADLEQTTHAKGPPQAGRRRLILGPQIALAGSGEPDTEHELLAQLGPDTVMMMGDNPALPKMPEKPTLLDFFRLRFKGVDHLVTSATKALEAGHEEKVVLACLLHDISLASLIRTDHGYWGAQMIAPYVDEEISWAVKHHQALRFYEDPSVGYYYPESYKRFFGEDYVPPEYIRRDAEAARNHRWYMTARLITLNDIYIFDRATETDPEIFADIIGRHFRQPEEGLGFDGSPVAHMWRSIIWPNNFL